MEVNAVNKGKSLGKGNGKKSKSKGKDKAKDMNKEQDPAANPRYYCHLKSHRKPDCRTFEEDKDKMGVNALAGLTPGAVAAPSGLDSRGKP